MIYLASDLHLPQYSDRLSEKRFPQQNQLKKEDYLVVCGDLCAYWNNSEEEKTARTQLAQKNFTTLFVDGNHENFDYLEGLQVREWNGGKVHITDSGIIHLMRGQVFHINGMSFFTLGGGYSGDAYHRQEHINWWRDEIPTREEFGEALRNLSGSDWKVDYVITHSASVSMIQKANLNCEETLLNVFLDYIENHLQFRHWFFGHYHQDIAIDKRHTLLFDRVVPLPGTPA